MSVPTSSQSPREVVQVLARRVQQLELAGSSDALPRVSSGFKALDRVLPGGGFAAGTLVEWIATGPGSGASLLALLAARQFVARHGPLVVMDRRGVFYPPAAAAWGIDPEQMILVRAPSDRDADWAIDQALRCPQVAAVLAWPEALDGRTARRWQLAAGQSGNLGLLVRPAAAQGQPSWASVRLLVRPRPGVPAWRLQVELLRCRGKGSGAVVDLVLEEPAESVPRHRGAARAWP